MKIGMAFKDSEPGPTQAPAVQQSPRVDSLAVLTRIMPAEKVGLAIGLLGGDEQAHKYAMFARELETLKASSLLVEVPKDALTCHKVADIVKDCATAVAELERTRKARVQPLNEEVKKVNALYALLTDQLGDIRSKADKLVIAHNQAERARIQREQEEQQRKLREAAEREAEATRKAQEAKTAKAREKALAEAEAASREIAAVQVAQPADAPTAYKTDVGTLSITKRVVLVGFDPDKVPQRYWRDPDVMEALRKVLAKAVRAGYHDIPGCTLGEEESTRATR